MLLKSAPRECLDLLMTGHILSGLLLWLMELVEASMVPDQSDSG